MIRLLLFALGILSCEVTIVAQATPNFCGTVGKSPWLIKYQANRQAYTSKESNEWLYVPITFHIVGTDNGTGYFPLSGVFKALCHMNMQFEPARIKCYLHPDLPFNYLENTRWYAHDWDGGQEMITTNNLPARVNAYIVDDPAGNCGYSWLDAIVLGKNCSGPINSTWAHELGHHLSLPHPFFGWEGQTTDAGKPAPATLAWGVPVEKVARVNCLVAGDGFCDTEPDYISYRWSCNSEGRSIQYLDPDSVAFRADGTYIMGYANDACQSRFTPDQIAAMRANLKDEHISYLTVNQPGASIIDDTATKLLSPVDSASQPHNQVNFLWEALPGAEYYFLEIGLTPSFIPLLHSKMLVKETRYTYPYELPKNRTFYWRVRAFNRWDVCSDQPNVRGATFVTAGTSGTNELEQAYTVSLSPNPAVSGLDVQLRVESDQYEDVTLSLYHLNGRMVWETQARIYEGEQNLVIPTTQLPSGQFRLTIRSHRGIISLPLTLFE